MAKRIYFTAALRLKQRAAQSRLALSAACVTCGARRGERCQTLKGNDTSFVHATRRGVAARWQDTARRLVGAA